MNRRTALALIGSILFIGAASVCLARVDSSASKVADSYLEAVKILDLPEGKKLLKGIQWQAKTSYPAFTDYTTLYEGMFETDVMGVQGYKRLVVLKTMSKGGQPLKVRYLLICYRDRSSGNWKVYDFSKGTDTRHEAEYFGSRLDTGIDWLGETIRQVNYRRYGHWLTMDGKLRESLKAFEKAVELNKKNPDRHVKQSTFELEVEIVRKIIGK